MMAEIIRGIEFRKGSSTHENEKRIEAMSKQRKEWKKKEAVTIDKKRCKRHFCGNYS